MPVTTMETSAQPRLNLITSYGLFWTVDKTEWLRGEGRSPKGRMLVNGHLKVRGFGQLKVRTLEALSPR